MDLREEKIKKLEKLKSSKINPYPNRVKRTHTLKEIREDFEKLSEGKKEIIIAGRIKLIRKHGKATFIDLEDFGGNLQIYLKEEILGKANYQLFQETIDLGDFLEVKGVLFLTKTQEKTLKASEWRVLAKTLMPLPEKWHGLVEVEARFRQRYLDLLSNKDVREIFLKRSLLIKLIREFFDSRGFIEVETPTLQPIPGGAIAKPFVTHHQALDLDLYLRIAPELYLKKMLVGGFEKVYEIARCFRNEGIDRAHNPEFTQIEFYEAYKDYNGLMNLTEELMGFLLEKTKTNSLINYQGRKINLAPPYPRLSYRESLIKYAGLDIEKIKGQELRKKAEELKIELKDEWDDFKILEEVFKEKVRSKIDNPVFIIDHPLEISPLAKKTEYSPNYVERFQLLIAGLEITNAYSEINDPLDQRERMKQQQELLERGDEEAQRIDEDFLSALEYGMPPAAGEGIGLDRLVSIFCDVHNLREVILFPTMRPKTS